MAKKTYFMGTDIGTTGTKTLITDINGGIIASSYAEYNVSTPRPMWAEQWPDAWFDAVCSTIRDTLEKSGVKAGEVAGITISGLYGGSGIPCDKEMNPIHPCLIWMDRRATEEVEWVKKNIGEDKIFDITANYIDSYYGYTKILWLKNHQPDIWKKTKHLMTPYGYCIYRLTGAVSMDYSSAGNIGGVFDLNKRDFSGEMLSAMGIGREMFPEQLVDSSDVVGKVSPIGSTLTGLEVGTPVSAGGVDAAVSTLSAGAFDTGTHVAMMGTSMCWGFIHGGESLSKGLVSMPHVADAKGRIYSFSGLATSGAMIKWFRDTLGVTEIESASESGADPYQLLDKEAEAVAVGSGGLLVLPYFMGERAPLWDVNARGTIAGLTLYHTKAHIYRAFLESVAYGLRNCIEEGRSAGVKLAENLLMVGGATKSPIWKKILADVSGYPIVCVKGGGEAAYGDAFLSAVGTGAIKDFNKIKDWLRYEPEIKPDAFTAMEYNRRYETFKELYRAVKPIFPKIAELN